MTDSPVLIEEIGAILALTLNRPEKYNALNRDTLLALREGVESFAARSDLRVLLIRASGRYFCAGADLSEGEVPPHHGSTSAVRTWYRRELNGMLSLYMDLEAMEKPIVVAHQGNCVGGGLELSMSCDFRLAAEGITYSFPEGSFGSLPATGGVSRLTGLVGPHWARWMITANKSIDAARALAIGLVHEVYPAAEFEAKVMEFCRHLVAQPPEFLAMSKVAIDLAAELDPASARKLERLANSSLSVGDEHQQLLAAWRARFRPRPDS